MCRYARMLKLEDGSKKMEEVKRIDPVPPLDTETFAVLEQEILPQLITRARLDHQPLRVWVVECGTGEAATIIMLLLARLLGSTLPNFRIKIFATDRNETHLACAHRGIFERNILSQFQDSEIACLCPGCPRCASALNPDRHHSHRSPLPDSFFQSSGAQAVNAADPGGKAAGFFPCDCRTPLSGSTSGHRYGGTRRNEPSRGTQATGSTGGTAPRRNYGLNGAA